MSRLSHFSIRVQLAVAFCVLLLLLFATCLLSISSLRRLSDGTGEIIHANHPKIVLSYEMLDVVTEVRSLAQRSAAAAHEIKTQIGNSVQKVKAGSALVEQAGVTTEEIVASIRSPGSTLREITSRSLEQSAGFE